LDVAGFRTYARCVKLECTDITWNFIMGETTDKINYFRKDQKNGISPPNLAMDCTYSEHIVRARGKRTKFTSVSLEPNRIRDFGPTLYKLKSDEVISAGHQIVEHQSLLNALRNEAQNGVKAERVRALQAIRYAKRRKEGLVDWEFDISNIDRKKIIAWAKGQINKYFSRQS